MTHKNYNRKYLRDIIYDNNISIDFLESSLGNEQYHTSEFDYDNLFWKFHYVYENFFTLLQNTEEELLDLRVVTQTTLAQLNKFLLKHKCTIGMFQNYTMKDLLDITNPKVRLEDLTPDEKSLSLAMIQCLVKQYPNDIELGKEIRRIFNELQD
jgi:hypothetical protein